MQTEVNSQIATGKRSISFFVPGTPKTSGSKRAFVIKGTTRAIVTDANPNSREWKNRVAQEAFDKVRSNPYWAGLLDGPLKLAIVFTMPRPKAHYCGSRAAPSVDIPGQKVLRKTVSKWPTTKPDLTKLCRCAEDSLKGIIWRDDSQVAQHSLEKIYGERPGAQITVEQIT